MRVILLFDTMLDHKNKGLSTIYLDDTYSRLPLVCVVIEKFVSSLHIVSYTSCEGAISSNNTTISRKVLVYSLHSYSDNV